MANPHVAGIAALLKSFSPSCSAPQLRRILLASVKDLGESGCDFHFGFGMVQAKAAVGLLKKHGCRAADELDLLSPNGMNDGSVCKPIPYEMTCKNGRESMTLDLFTDNRPAETSWVLMDTKGIKVASGENYAGAGTQHTEVVTICRGESYEFTIYDSDRDGICCRKGSGSYTVRYGNKTVKANGGRFGASETISFTTPLPTLRQTNQQDNAPPSAPPIKTPPTPAPPVAPSDPRSIFINTGGPNIRDPDGNLWVSDAQYNVGKTHSTSVEIANTDKPMLYQTERYAPDMRYDVSIANGAYDVYFHYAEIYGPAFLEGARVFDVFLEGELVTYHMDIYKRAGGKGYRAYVIGKKGVTVNDGSLTIDFIGVKEKAKISAIEIHPSSRPSTRQ